MSAPASVSVLRHTFRTIVQCHLKWIAEIPSESIDIRSAIQ